VLQAADLGTIRLVCFSGGEAFLLNQDLVELVELAASRALMTRVVTNGYWATSERAALRRLEPLVEAGLNEINFSTGDDHAEYVPQSRIICGIAAALKLGMPVALMVESRAQRAVTAESLLPELEAHPDIAPALARSILTIVESPWMPFGEESKVIEQPSSAMATRYNLDQREPCRSVLSTVVVTPDEQLAMCCGLPREGIADLHAGSLREESMKALVDKGLHDFLKIWLFVEGPERILAWAASKDETIEWENLYAHNCDACRAMYRDDRVMTLIQEHYHEKFEEVTFKYALYCAGAVPPQE
jgi:hypothetical protein